VRLEKSWPFILMVWGGALLVFLYFLLQPLIFELDRIKQERENLAQQVLRLERRVASLRAMEKRLEELRSTVEAIEARLPQEKEVPQLLLAVEDAAFLSDSEVESLTPQALRNEKDYTEVPLKIKLRSSYRGTLLFLNTLRRIPRLIQLEEISFVPGSEGGFDVDLTLKTYILGVSGGNR
jgi:Tfp pilus assembly protein PilO